MIFRRIITIFLDILFILSSFNLVDSRSCGFWYSSTFNIGGCRVNPFELQICASDKDPTYAFYVCLFKKNRSNYNNYYNYYDDNDYNNDDYYYDNNNNNVDENKRFTVFSGYSYSYYNLYQRKQRQQQRVRRRKTRNCSVDRRKMEYCTYRYPSDAYSAIMCYLMPNTWHY